VHLLRLDDAAGQQRGVDGCKDAHGEAVPRREPAGRAKERGVDERGPRDLKPRRWWWWCGGGGGGGGGAAAEEAGPCGRGGAGARGTELQPGPGRRHQRAAGAHPQASGSVACPSARKLAGGEARGPGSGRASACEL